MSPTAIERDTPETRYSSDLYGTRGTGHRYARWVYVGYFPTGFRNVVIRQLDRLGTLTANWDRQGALPLDPAILRAARQFISGLPEGAARAPRVVPMAKGNLQFEWHDGSRSLELEVEDPGTIHYLRWHPEEGIEDEGFFDIRDLGRAETLIRWFMKGIADV